MLMNRKHIDSLVHMALAVYTSHVSECAKHILDDQWRLGVGCIDGLNGQIVAQEAASFKDPYKV